MQSYDHILPFFKFASILKINTKKYYFYLQIFNITELLYILSNFIYEVIDLDEKILIFNCALSNNIQMYEGSERLDENCFKIEEICWENY